MMMIESMMYCDFVSWVRVNWWWLVYGYVVVSCTRVPGILVMQCMCVMYEYEYRSLLTASS